MRRFKEEAMNNPRQETTMSEPTLSDPALSAPIAAERKVHFNFNKLQAVACIALSAAASVGLIAWAVTSFG